MAEQNVTPEHRADEIAALRQQLEEMQKRLEELSAADATAQGAPSVASPSGVQEASLQSDESKAEFCADAKETPDENADSAAASHETNSATQSVEYEPYVPPSAAAHRSNVEAAPDISPSSSADKQQANNTAQQAASQKPDEAQSGYTYQATSQQQSTQTQQVAQAQAQQASQAQNPYEGAYAGQQVPFGQTGPQQQYYQQAQQAYYGYGVQQNNAYQASLAHSKDHVAAALLAIFLGVFGIHKFYLGYHTAGFIMLGVTILGSLFTFGLAAAVMWLIGVIEGVTYLVKDQAEFERIYVSKKREWF